MGVYKKLSKLKKILTRPYMDLVETAWREIQPLVAMLHSIAVSVYQVGSVQGKGQL